MTDNGYSSEEDSDSPPRLIEIVRPENDPTNPAFVGWKLPMRITEYADGSQDVEYHRLDPRPNVVASDTRSMYWLEPRVSGGVLPWLDLPDEHAAAGGDTQACPAPVPIHMPNIFHGVATQGMSFIAKTVTEARVCESFESAHTSFHTTRRGIEVNWDEWEAKLQADKARGFDSDTDRVTTTDGLNSRLDRLKNTSPEMIPANVCDLVHQAAADVRPLAEEEKAVAARIDADWQARRQNYSRFWATQIDAAQDEEESESDELPSLEDDVVVAVATVHGGTDDDDDDSWLTADNIPRAGVRFAPAPKPRAVLIMREDSAKNKDCLSSSSSDADDDDDMSLPCEKCNIVSLPIVSYEACGHNVCVPCDGTTSSKCPVCRPLPPLLCISDPSSALERDPLCVVCKMQVHRDNRICHEDACGHWACLKCHEGCLEFCPLCMANVEKDNGVIINDETLDPMPDFHHPLILLPTKPLLQTCRHQWNM